MRVRIGPYPGTWGMGRPLDWWFSRRRGVASWAEVDEEDHDRLDVAVTRVLDAIEWVLNRTVNRLLRRRRRVVRVRLDPWDHWDADRTIALIAHPVLVQLRASPMFGTAFHDPRDVPSPESGLPATGGSHQSPAEDTVHPETWAEVEEGGPEAIERYTQGWAAIIDAMIWSFAQLNAEERDELPPGADRDLRYEERIDYGLRMFGKYYRRLWE